jgi:MFS family permease
MPAAFQEDIQYSRFCLYGFFKNLRFFEAFLVLFLLDKDLTFLAIGTLYAIREITVNVFEIPSGVIADAFGRRRTMILAFVFYIISFVAFYLSEEYSGFLLAMLLFALGEAFRSGNHKAMIYHYLSKKGWKDQKVHYYGNTRSWSQMGSAISAMSGAVIVFFTGSYAYIFLFSVIPYILDLILVSTYPAFLDGGRIPFRWKEVGKRFREVFGALLKSIRSVKVLRILGSLSVYSGYYKAIKDYLQPVVAAWAITIPVHDEINDDQRTATMVGVVFFAVYALSSLASRNSGRFSERFGSLSVPMNMSMLIGLACGILSGLFYSIDLGMLSVIFFILVYMVENIRKPVGVAYLGGSVDKRVMASVLSIDSQLKSLIAAILAPLFGIFADLYGVGWSVMIISAGVFIFLPLIRLRPEQQNG